MYSSPTPSYKSQPPKSLTSDKHRLSSSSFAPSWIHPIEVQSFSAGHSVPISPSTLPPYTSPEPGPPSYHSGSGSIRSGSSVSTVPLLHPALHPGRVVYDVRRSAKHARFCEPTDIQDLAFNPPTARVRIRVPGHPTWSFTVDNIGGVTLENVISGLHSQLYRSVEQTEFAQLSPESQAAASTSFHERTSGNPNEYVMGLKRVDCIGRNFSFVGLSLDKRDSAAWILNLTPYA